MFNATNAQQRAVLHYMNRPRHNGYVLLEAYCQPCGASVQVVTRYKNPIWRNSYYYDWRIIGPRGGTKRDHRGLVS